VEGKIAVKLNAFRYFPHGKIILKLKCFRVNLEKIKCMTFWCLKMNACEILIDDG
jgi:hypothetical protein